MQSTLYTNSQHFWLIVTNRERERECNSPSHNSVPHLSSASVGGVQGNLLSGMMSLVALVMASHSGSYVRTFG